MPVEEEVIDFEEFTGRTDATRTVEVRARVTGYLQEIDFKDGEEVEEDAPLFLIDPRPYEAALERAEGALAQAIAREKRAEADFLRKDALYARQTISREEFDLAVDNYAESRASIKVAEADRKMAALDLEYTRVKAEIPGRLSRRQVDIGNLVRADDTILTTIVSIDKLYIYFDIDERTLLKLRRLVQNGRMQSRSNGDEIPIHAALADDEDFHLSGMIDFSDNRVDSTTGTLQVRAVIDNPRPHLLSPGLFLRIRLPIGRPRQALLIAERALGTDQGQKYLYVINEKDEVIFRPVKVGALHGMMRVVESGLNPDERVVVSGLQRIQPGVKVVPKPEEHSPGGDPPSNRESSGPLARGESSPVGKPGG